MTSRQSFFRSTCIARYVTRIRGLLQLPVLYCKVSEQNTSLPTQRVMYTYTAVLVVAIGMVREDGAARSTAPARSLGNRSIRPFR